MHRRDILKAVASAVPLVTAGRLWAAPRADMRTLIVFLRGGYDAANVVIPVSSTFYYEARRSIAVPRPGSGSNAAVPLNSDWGLHPALRDAMHPLWEKKQLAFVPFAGTDDLTRSHFETQDTIELGQPTQGSRNYNSGFMARLADRADPHQADRLHRTAAAGIPRCRQNTQCRNWFGRQTRSR